MHQSLHNILPFDPEIEKMTNRRRHLAWQQAQQEEVESESGIVIELPHLEEMAEERANRNQQVLRDFALPSTEGSQTSIAWLAVNANNFEIKPALIQMLSQEQFEGNTTKDPNAYLANFLEICNTIKFNGVSDDTIKFWLFPFSLRDKAKVWLNSHAPNIFITWTDLSKAFLNKYFPLGKTVKLRLEITSFAQ